MTDHTPLSDQLEVVERLLVRAKAFGASTPGGAAFASKISVPWICVDAKERRTRDEGLPSQVCRRSPTKHCGIKFANGGRKRNPDRVLGQFEIVVSRSKLSIAATSSPGSAGLPTCGAPWHAPSIFS
jgi:hypothetical protein